MLCLVSLQSSFYLENHCKCNIKRFWAQFMCVLNVYEKSLAILLLNAYFTFCAGGKVPLSVQIA